MLKMLVDQSGRHSKLQDKVFVLKHIYESILMKCTSWDISSSHQVIFMVIMLGYDLPKDLIKTLELQNGQAYLEALMVSQEEMQARFSLLENLE